MLAEGKEVYTEFALKHYDWERIEKTKGEVIDDQRKYASEVFDTVTGEVRKPTDYFGNNRKSLTSSMFIFAPALVFSSVAALIKLSTGLGPPTLMAPVALLILNTLSD
jgi:hypothetical protein